LRRGLGRNPASWRTPLWALSCAALCGDVFQTLSHRKVPFSHSTLEKLIGPAWYSPEALIREMGYKPQHDFESAVAGIIQHYRGTLAPCG